MVVQCVVRVAAQREKGGKQADDAGEAASSFLQRSTTANGHQSTKSSVLRMRGKAWGPQAPRGWTVEPESKIKTVLGSALFRFVSSLESRSQKEKPK